MSPRTEHTANRGGADSEIQAHPTGPRSRRVHDATLRATRELLAEGGLAAATVDAIAARSGVSKATIYKHWPSRTAVAAEAFGGMMGDALPLPDTGSAVGDFTAQVRQVSAFYATQPVFAQLLASCVTDPSGSPYFRKFFLAGRREAIATLWQRAIDRGEANPDVDVETATDLVFGPLIFRLMSGHRPLTPEEADKVTAAALGGLLRK
ncbi:MAG TPA: TetR/AcrR family transcriptional regulator [Amycolatopsis sp.]|nr:TetR/AcrR family transcriptional regulator [Amycolatopsis sp.]